MGRYAFFSTGLERKFAFGIQDSADIRLFGGVNATTAEDISMGNYRHTWSADRDSSEALRVLQSYASDSVQLPDFGTFEGTVEGTYMLRNWLYSHISEYYKSLGESYYTFELGCCIYHQLTYEPELTAGYEP